MSILSVASAEVRAVEDTVQVTFRGYIEGGAETVMTIRMAPFLAHDLNRRISDQASLHNDGRTATTGRPSSSR
jgi:hypothetical protein